MPVALKGSDQLIKVAARIADGPKALDRVLDRLAPDHQGRSHLGSHRASGVGIGYSAAEPQTDQ